MTFNSGFSKRILNFFGISLDKINVMLYFIVKFKRKAEIYEFYIKSKIE